MAPLQQRNSSVKTSYNRASTALVPPSLYLPMRPSEAHTGHRVSCLPWATPDIRPNVGLLGFRNVFQDLQATGSLRRRCDETAYIYIYRIPMTVIIPNNARLVQRVDCYVISPHSASCAWWNRTHNSSLKNRYTDTPPGTKHGGPSGEGAEDTIARWLGCGFGKPNMSISCLELVR